MHSKTLFSIAGAAVFALIAGVAVGDDEARKASTADDTKLAQAQAAKPAAAGQAERATVSPADAQNKDLIARGKYLTHDVAMCVICHSPKDSNGNVIKNKEFRGGAIPVDSPFSGPRWADLAPALPPLVQERADDVFLLLTTGIWPRSGKPAQGPMPPFRLSEEDARAVIAYLKTLN